MKTQTFTGTVLDTAGDPWADALVELQLDDGSGEISSGPVVTGVTDVDGAFSIDAFNNAEDAQALLIRLPNGNVFSIDLDPDDDTVDCGNLESSGGTSTARLSEIPSGGGTSLSKASGAEIDTGTDDAKYVTPKAIEDSDYIKAAAVNAAIAAAAAGVGKRAAVRAATTANITISTALNNGDTLDGVTLATGDLVLVKDQSTPSQNGIYVVGAVPARDAQYDTYNEHPGSLIVVEEGTANADTMWFCTSNAGGTLDTTAIAFTSVNITAATTTTHGALVHAATSKTTPVDADELGLVDSAASNILKRLTWANLKATLKTYFDTLYTALGFTTTPTAAATTALTVADSRIQAFTGSTTQTVVLPVVSTLPQTGFGYWIINDSTGILTVNSSGGNLVQTIPAGFRAYVFAILLTGTNAASWDAIVFPNWTNGGAQLTATQDLQFIVGNNDIYLNAGLGRVRMSTIRMRSDGGLIWNDNASLTGGVDTGVVRHSAGLVRISDGSTGLGKIAVAGGTPASAGATGVQGQILWDGSFIYVCVATNTWLRAAIATW